MLKPVLNRKLKDRESGILIPKDSYFRWIDGLRSGYKVFGPVRKGDLSVFEEISTSGDLFMEYQTTMLSPGKMFIYKPKEDILKFRMGASVSVELITPQVEKQVIVGIHPCDINAILYLDAHFSHGCGDPYFKTRRENTVLIALNCMQVSRNCFCSSVGAGPHLKALSGYDMVLTDFGDDYLVELKSGLSFEIFNLKGRKAGSAEWRLKTRKEEDLIKSIKKTVDVKGLDDLLMKNPDHPVWASMADQRCLSCSNCVMVCPTCFCYDVVDETNMDLKEGKRFRQLDACQDFRFAAVYGGNFRQLRASRLRQWVMHNLGYASQYGRMKTVGCGRCITWCPTGIDLTEMAKEVRRSPVR
jgi:sulfhydrogenase subunit beta (sulfur reductase)